MGDRSLGPELPDTAGNIVGVLIEVAPGAERGQPSAWSAVLGRKDRQVHPHALGEGQDQLADPPLVVRSESGQEIETGIQP